jgi:RsiW-degrading membrane proteinase PrsW (M82 family)
MTAALILILYFLPTFVAEIRHHPQKVAIAVLNLLLGWTLIGWVVALVWAIIKSPEDRVTKPVETWDKTAIYGEAGKKDADRKQKYLESLKDLRL